MDIEYTVYEDGDLDFRILAEGEAETALLSLVKSRNADCLGMDDECPGASSLIIRLQSSTRQ